MQQWLSYIEALNLGQQKAGQIASCHGYVSQFRYLKSLKSRPQKCVISSGNLIPLFRTLSLDLLGGRHTGVTRLIELETQKLLEVRHQGYVDGTKIKGFSEWKALVIIYIYTYILDWSIHLKEIKEIYLRPLNLFFTSFGGHFWNLMSKQRIYFSWPSTCDRAGDFFSIWICKYQENTPQKEYCKDYGMICTDCTWKTLLIMHFRGIFADQREPV